MSWSGRPSSAATASRSFHGTRATSGEPGRNSVALPWYAPSNMSSRRRPVARAAILAASSAASVPELVNRTRCTEGTRAASSSASATW